MARFRNINMSAPPTLFVEIGGERISGRSFMQIAPAVRAAMARHGVHGTAEQVIADYMCPRLGPSADLYCEGPVDEKDVITARESIENSLRYASLPVVTFDVIEARMVKCQSCPMHYRGWCATCNGHFAAMLSALGSSRPRLPVDATSGVCRCAKAYETMICSVDHGESKVWEGVPDTCWRKTDV